jgi:hypothetical protein
MEGESLYIRGLVLPLFCFLSFSPYPVICSHTHIYYLEYLHPGLYSHPRPCLCPCPRFWVRPCACSALPLFPLLSSPASVLWPITSLLNTDPLQLLHNTAWGSNVGVLTVCVTSSQVSRTSVEPSGSLSHTLCMTAITSTFWPM